MSNINKAAVLNPFTDLTANILAYVPRATTSEFGIVAIGSGINVDALGRIYLDTQEYSDRLTAIEAQAASSLTTQQTEVAAAIAQVNLTQSQTITALSLEVSNLKTDLTNSITATQTDLINRADELAQDVTDITQQLTQDKAAFTQEIQDALDYLKDDASVASALRTPRKIQGVGFDGTQDISLPTFTSETDGLVPKRIGATADNYLREDGTWVVPTDTTYALLTKASAEEGTATTANTISAQVLKEAIQYHAPTVTNIAGNAESATKLQTPRTINGVLFDGTQNILLPSSEDYSLPTASASVLGGIKVGSGLDISNSVLSVGTLNQSTTGNAATATKLQTARTIGGVSFDGSANINLPGINTAGNQSTSGNAATATKLQTARTLTVGRTGKAFDGSANVAWTATEVLPSATSGQLLKFDGTNWVATADTNTTYSAMSQAEAGTGTETTGRVITAAILKGAIQTHAPVQTSVTGNAGSATKLATARTINGVAFDGTTNIETPTATETTAGKAKIATTAIAQAGTNDTDIITALKLKQSFTSQHSNTGWEKLPDGLIIQWGLAAVGATTPFPIAFPTACYQVAVSYSSSSGGGMVFQHQSITATRTGVTMYSGGVPNSYIAIGK